MDTKPNNPGNKPNNPSTGLNMKANWNDIKSKMKQKYPSLTDDDLKYDQGKEDDFYARLQKKTGQTKEALKSWAESL